VPPAWPWAEDNSPMGSNDFRSTKRHIYWASIRYPDGPGMWVISDGTQHVRAAVDPDRVSVCVSDWYGGTNCGLSEWTSNYGDGRAIVPGERIGSTVHLRIGKAARTREAVNTTERGR
jgi:beta-galactosidase